ncbi:unnamed protein product [Lathyrus oleraceus]
MKTRVRAWPIETTTLLEPLRNGRN